MAQMIKKILFTSDLSKSSVEVFEQTASLAYQLEASITMLHVIEDGSDSSQNRMIHLVDKEVYERIRKESQDNVRNVLIGKQRALPVIENALRELCEDTSSKVCGDKQSISIDHIEVRYGDPAEAITELAETVDLVVMGYHRRGSLLKTLMGSNAGKTVLKKSKKPVFLIPLET